MQDLDGRQRNLEHELREALRLGRHRVAVEHDVHGFEVQFNNTAAPASPDPDCGDLDVMSDMTFADPGSLSDQELRDLIDRFAAREHVVSYERRALHGRMDLLRAELVGRLRLRHVVTAPELVHYPTHLTRVARSDQDRPRSNLSRHSAAYAAGASGVPASVRQWDAPDRSAGGPDPGTRVADRVEEVAGHKAGRDLRGASRESAEFERQRGDARQAPLTRGDAVAHRSR